LERAADGQVLLEGEDEPVGMEIPLGKSRRLLSLLGFLALLAVVAAVLVVLFIQFTASRRIALALVVFMVGYMCVMSYVILRRDDQGR
jgi:hypothetical protein